MTDYVKVIDHGDTVSVAFYIEEERILELGERIAEEFDDVEMNGYNWDAVLTLYMEKYARNLLNEMESDPEAGMYAAYYDNTPENRVRANALAELIRDLVEEESDLTAFLREYGDEVEWD